MKTKDYFVKVTVEKETMKMLRTHITGPEASILTEEIINLTYTPKQSSSPLTKGIHIHPVLTEAT
ncbi:hypothetical protein KAT21_02085 [Candidatus Bathyarchaeota archaeon]|nr:hypothetical protein [Candidatus Bathyarchaeota archaeon]